MKAIRCKSSSQVSSQVMIRVVLMPLYLVLVAAVKTSHIAQTTPSNTKVNAAFQIFHGDMDKYELCVKLIRVCRKVWDQAPDYSDAEEKAPDGMEVNDEDKAEYKKGDCIPPGLSKDGDRLFWKIVAKWQKEIDDRFLIQNLFVVIMTTENGRNTKLTFGKWNGWCNRTDNFDEVTEVPNDSNEFVSTLVKRQSAFKNCQVNATFGKWTISEIKGTRQLDKDINIISNFLSKFDKYAKSKCCPYELIRDRLEIINDGIDFLQELQGIESTSVTNYTDLNTDLSNLKDRVEDLSDLIQSKGGNYSTGKCCPNILSELENFRNDFADKLKFEGTQAPKFDHQPNIEKEKSLREMILSYVGDIGLLETSLMNQTKKSTYCEGEQTQIKNIKQKIKDIRPEKFLGELLKQIEPLNENLAEADQTISDAEKLLNMEKENMQKLNSLHGEEWHQKNKSFKDLESKVNQLEYRINNLNVLEDVNWPKLRKSVDDVNKMVENSPSFFANITIISMKNGMKYFKGQSTADFPINLEKKSEVRFCTNESIKLSDNLEKIEKDKNKIVAYHNEQENVAKAHFNELLDKEKELQYYSPKSLTLTDMSYKSDQSVPSTNSLQLEINQLEKDIDNLTENGIEKFKRQLQYTRLKFEMDKQQIDSKLEEQLRNINLFREEMNKEENRIAERLAKLDRPKEYDEKLSKLEAEAMDFPKQIASSEKTLLDQIALLQQQINALEKEAENTEHRADLCDAECDFGDLDSIDELMNRVQAVKNKLIN
ncbi:DNA repair protein RAD50 [Drosophila sechellia]|uniref:DNA repair protein RAD50 n=1 Tax=Drosophila sechellia TaxID=7238 RepID=UPI0013DDEC66|nr:DNA repair protein RAD50 [Drosophila sechellia]